jgi:HD superfamily phosphohydrolase
VNAAPERRGGRIADPVHRYVDFTWIERLILDQPVAQRLRYVRQNGLGHLVYPEANSSRFAHSLGTMHLASRFLHALLANSDVAARTALCAAIGESVDEVAGAVAGHVKSFQALPPEATRCIHSYAECAEHQEQLKIAEQGLRLAALFHDLGHLPFSHDFEEGLQLYWDELTTARRRASPFDPLFREARKSGEKLHERLGHGLALLLFNEAFASLGDAEVLEAVRVSFEFAYRILVDAPRRPSSPPEAALALLHNLIDGELDVDRCDYILRDGRNYGFEFALYDLDRLVDNLRIAQAENQFQLAVRSHGLSALESFVLARYRSYEHGVRHHKVAQVGSALRYSVAQVLTGHRDSSPVRQFALDVGRIGQTLRDDMQAQARRELLERFAHYDDGWFMGLLRRLYTKTGDPWLGVACWRQSAFSLWKRADHFRALVGGNIEAWNRDLPSWNDDKQVEAWNREVKRLRKEGVLVLRHKFEPWKRDPLNADDSVLLVETTSGYEPLNRASVLVDSLRLSWQHAVQVQAFVSVGGVIQAQDVLGRLPRVEQKEGA